MTSAQRSRDNSCRWPPGGRLLPLLPLVALLAGCGELAQAPAPTATGYPRRSPVAASPAATPAGRPDAAAAVATAEGLLSGGDLAAAAAAWSRAVALDPGNAAAYLGRASTLAAAAEGRPDVYQDALDDVQRALAAEPGSVMATLTRAEIFLARLRFRGDPADAERALAELDALPAAAGGEPAVLLRAEALAALGKQDRAREVLAAPVVSTVGGPAPDPAARALAEARVALAARRWDEAAAAADAAHLLAPGVPDALILQAEAALGRGEPAAALAAAEAALERRADDGVARFLRALALLDAGRVEEGRRAIIEARDRLAASPVYQARIEQRLRRLDPAATLDPSGTARAS